MHLKKALPFLMILIAIPLALLLFTGFFGQRIDREALTMAEQSIRRAAVECYALEGAYPTGLAYLEDHYGVEVDPDRYRVDYVYIASNLMPDITVLALG